MPSDKRSLLKGLSNLPTTWKRVIERFPAEMIVYPHFERGRLAYLSGRSITGKRHYNPPADIIGARQPYKNTVYKEDGQDVVIVEGRADALTLDQWPVLRILQPMAFNMISTSDPTGPSMFRMIHYTSCTVGIDEAERYHNPRDPGMQQIRQLLNSGYKSGMPAIRLVGEDMKPQAFDVYSPKIMGMEDILASRCIAIPMRRTDKKMPIIPNDFDGASLRHELYTLSLSFHQEVYRNYFERPEIHKLTNRSGELWQPLVALAGFFEEAGVNGLLDAISHAAEWDEQISAGKSLSDREEAVLQALEIMTRGQEKAYWVKSADLRRLVAHLTGENAENMGNAQWIGHIMKRLHLIDERRRKRLSDGIIYSVMPEEVRDMMRRYNVDAVTVDDDKSSGEGS